MTNRTKRLAVLTSGGDAAGMNAAIRAVVRVGIAGGAEVFGVHDGYTGLLEGRLSPLSSRDAGGIMQRGGTVLGSSRSAEFMTDAGQERAVEQLRSFGIDGLVVIGGNGTQAGAAALSERGVRVAGVASTIDNDLFGFEQTLGFDTAVNIALEAIDRLKTTAWSHDRAFIVEVMGRDHGHLALAAGIAGGAEVIVLPEADTTLQEVAASIRQAYDLGKQHAIVVVAEGATLNGDALVQGFIAEKDNLGFDLRLTKLGHVQRGGIPTVVDRQLGTLAGAAAVQSLLSGESGVIFGQRERQVESLPLSEVAGRKKELDVSLLELGRLLAT